MNCKTVTNDDCAWHRFRYIIKSDNSCSTYESIRYDGSRGFWLQNWVTRKVGKKQSNLLLWDRDVKDEGDRERLGMIQIEKIRGTKHKERKDRARVSSHRGTAHLSPWPCFHRARYIRGAGVLQEAHESRSRKSLLSSFWPTSGETFPDFVRGCGGYSGKGRWRCAQRFFTLFELSLTRRLSVE